MSAFALGLFAFFANLKEICQIGALIFKFVLQEYETYERNQVLKDIRSGLQESIQTGDNSKLAKIFNPEAPQ